MKQPELGKKISELRKTKGLTQEELVDKCNISVRTLQRIETGEVTPRVFTIKAIFAALDFEWDVFEGNDNVQVRSIADWCRKYILFDIDLTESSDFITSQINLAWISGMAYFLIGFFVAAAEYFRYREEELIFGTAVYVALKVSSIVAFVLFQRGFVLIGGLYKNYMLRITSFFLIFGSILITAYDIGSVFYYSIERQFILGSEAIVFGCIGILYGISLWRLRNPVGSAAAWAGFFEIVSGLFFLTVILSFIGFITEVPAELCEIIVLFKCTDIVKSKQELSVAAEAVS